MGRPSTTRAKVTLVATGYIVAVLVAAGVVAVYVTLTDGPYRHASSGMYAFGDALLFLAVFAAVGAVPTGAALFYLRSWRRCWPVLGVVGLVVAATGALSLADYLVTWTGASRALGAWSAFGVLRILVAPLLALGFGLATVFSPTRPSRLLLLAATLVELAVFGGWVAALWIRWLQTR
jgi:hypothetical protein